MPERLSFLDDQDERGLKFRPLSMSASDLQFIAVRTFSLDEIVLIPFRIPPSQVGLEGNRK